MRSRANNYQILSWVVLARRDYPDDYAACIQHYGDNTHGQYAAAECAYIQHMQALPDWSHYIESFELVGDSYLFIHCDPDVQQ